LLSKNEFFTYDTDPEFMAWYALNILLCSMFTARSTKLTVGDLFLSGIIQMNIDTEIQHSIPDINKLLNQSSTPSALDCKQELY
jgi:hypothetical protein